MPNFIPKYFGVLYIEKIKVSEDQTTYFGRVLFADSQTDVANAVADGNDVYIHTGKCIRRFAGIYAYCRYFIDRKW